MVRFHIDYCCSVPTPYKKGDIEALAKVCQHRDILFILIV